LLHEVEELRRILVRVLVLQALLAGQPLEQGLLLAHVAGQQLEVHGNPFLFLADDPLAAPEQRAAHDQQQRQNEEQHEIQSSEVFRDAA